MEFDNKSILIIGLIACALLSMFLRYEQIGLAIVSGLVGYLSKDVVDKYTINNHNPTDLLPEEDDQDDI